jgi:hypothetical protein
MPIRVPTDRPTVDISDTATPGGRCPACGQPLFGWMEAAGSDPADRRLHVMDRCESCRLGLEREDAGEALADLIEGIEERVAEAGEATLDVANGTSVQAGIGAENWSALNLPAEPYVLNPKALDLLLEHEELEISRISYPMRRAMAAMMLTLLNLITFNRNFAAEALHGRLRPAAARPGPAAYFVDAAITALAAIPVAIISVVLEAGASLARRGGVLRATIRRRHLG